MRSRVIAILCAVMLAAPQAWALEYTSTGKTVATGYNGPGISDAEIAYLGTLSAITTVIEFVDITRIASTFGLLVGTLSWGVYRKEYWEDQAYLPDGLGKVSHMNVWNGRL